MRKIIKHGRRYCMLLCLLLPITALGQHKTMHLKGYIAVSGGESFTYELVFTDSANVIKGYSLTYLQQTNEVKSTIEGTLDKAQGLLTFKETGIIYNHGFHSNATICLVAATLKYSNNKNGAMLKGHLNSADMANAYCGTGTITFINKEELDAVFNTTADATTITPKPAVAETHSVVPANHNKIIVQEIYPEHRHQQAQQHQQTADEITAGVEKVYAWHSDTVVIELWDGGHIDGDRVTLQYNGKTLLDNYTLTAEKKEVRVPVSEKGTDELTVIAGSEGNEPPNTANLLLKDGNKEYNIVAYNKIGQTATVKIRRAH